MANRVPFEQLLTDLNIADDDAHAKAQYLVDTFVELDTLENISTGHFSWTGFTDYERGRIMKWCHLKKEAATRKQAKTCSLL